MTPIGFFESSPLIILDKSMKVRPRDESFEESTSIITSSSVPPNTFNFSVFLSVLSWVLN